jgi:hypothetical protein
MDHDQFWITDNLGRRYEMQRNFNGAGSTCSYTGYDPPIDIGIEPGEKFSYNMLRGVWTVEFSVPVTDPNITLLTIHVANLSRIAKAEWQIPIEH